MSLSQPRRCLYLIAFSPFIFLSDALCGADPLFCPICTGFLPQKQLLCGCCPYSLSNQSLLHARLHNSFLQPHVVDPNLTPPSRAHAKHGAEIQLKTDI